MDPWPVVDAIYPLTPTWQMEVGGPVTWGLELPTANPGSKSIPRACPTCNPAMSPTRHTQPQPKHPSHRATSSVEIIITVINKIIENFIKTSQLNTYKIKKLKAANKMITQYEKNIENDKQ